MRSSTCWIGSGRSIRNIRAIQRREPARVSCAAGGTLKHPDQVGRAVGRTAQCRRACLGIPPSDLSRIPCCSGAPGRALPRPRSKQDPGWTGCVVGRPRKAGRERPEREPEWEVAESWQEALRLVAADCRDDDVDDVLQAIGTPMAGEHPERVTKARAVLAARCLADEPNVSEDTAAKVLKHLVSEVSERDGKGGPARTSLDEAAVELGRSLWAPLLERYLADDFFHRDPSTRHSVGGVLSMAEISGAPRSERDFAEWFRHLPALLQSGDDTELTRAALAVMDASFSGRAILAPGLVASLLDLLPKGGAIAHAAAWALGWMSRGPATGPPVWKPGHSEVERLLEALRATPPREAPTRRWLVVALIGLSDPCIPPAMIGLLQDPYAEVRRVAAEALGELGAQEAIVPLIPNLEDPEPQVRLASVEALGKLGGHQVVAPLITKLEDPNSAVCVAAVGHWPRPAPGLGSRHAGSASGRQPCRYSSSRRYGRRSSRGQARRPATFSRP